jgi:hypothetical protein
MSIKFSHLYRKLLDESNDIIEGAYLLEVLVVELAELSAAFLDYDTDSGKFTLPKRGKYMMLIFKKPHEDYICAFNLFTTLRRWTAEKEAYYRSLIGKPLGVEYVPPPENKGNGLPLRTTAASCNG